MKNFHMIPDELAESINFGKGPADYKYPWNTIEVGKMFFVEQKTLNTLDSKVSIPQTIRDQGKRFTIRKWVHPNLGNGYVVKRLEDNKSAA